MMSPRRVAGLLLGLVLAASIPAAARAAEPSVAECLAASDDSIKLDNDHKLRATRASLLACAAPGCPAEVRKECIRRVEEVSAAIPTIIFEARDGAGNDLGLVKITMDDEVIADRLDGIAIAIDPGTHVFKFESPGLRAVSRRFVIRQGQKNRSEVVLFDAQAKPPRARVAEAAAPTPPPATGAPVTSPPAASMATATATQAPGPTRMFATQPPPELDAPTGGHAKLAITAAVVGVVATGVGAVFGLRAISKRDDAQKVCPAASCTDQTGVDLWHDARTAGNLATGAFAVGGVALVGAAILWLTAKPESPPAVTARAEVGSNGFTLALRSAW